MSDIVDELRYGHSVDCKCVGCAAADEIERLRSEWGATKTCTSCGYFDTEYSTDGWGWCDRYAASRPVDHFCAEWQEACRG